MSELFADIYEAIRILRIQKGASEKDILKYIEERVGGCLKAVNFMKTVRTLQKLVDEGVLVKKGKRFTFSSNLSKQKDEEEEEEEDDNDDDCEEDDEEAELDMDDDECDEADGEENDCEEDEDEDEDDDDDEEDEEDEEDDDEDDACDDKDLSPEKKLTSKDNSKPAEEDPLKTSTKEKFILSPKKQSGDGSGKTDSDYGNGVKSIKSKENDGKNSGRIANKETRNVVEQSGGLKSKEGEAIAFCVRDFIDSLYRPSSDCQNHEKIDKSDSFLRDNLDEIEMDEIGRVSEKRKRKSRTKRVNQSRNTYRSRSPIKKINADKFISLKRDRSDDMCYRVASTQFLPEPMDADMDVDVDKEADVVVDYDSFRHRSPVGPPPPSTPGVHVDGKESFSSTDNKEADSHFEEDNEHSPKKQQQTKSSQMDNDMNGQNGWFPSEEEGKEQETFKRNFPIEDEANDEQRTRLCSFCEKKIID